MVVGNCPGVASIGVKRKLSTSVAVSVSAPDFLVPRVPVRHGKYVVPRVRARPHGTERALYGLTSVSDLRVPSLQADDGVASLCVPVLLPGRGI